MPLFNNFGDTVVLNGAFYNGGTIILHERWDQDRVLGDIERHKVSVFFGTPTMFTFLLKGNEAARRDLSSLRICLAGGAVLVPSLVQEFEAKLNTRLLNIYGATEASGYVTAEPLHGARVAGSAADREKLVQLMEGVEDIPGPVMHEGLTWNWESFPEYLTALERTPRDIDLCALLPHAALRVYVMGDRAIRHEKATAADIAAMRTITRDAVRAGAFGFSTSRTISHKTLAGDYTPTLRANEGKLIGIAIGMRDAGAGFLEMVSDWNEPDARTEFAMLRRVVERSGRTAVFSLTERHEAARSEVWKELLGYADDAIKSGLSIRPVVPPRPIGLLLGLEGSQNPFSGTSSYKAIAGKPLAERVAIMRDPEVRARILSEDPIAGSTFPLIRRLIYTQMFRFGNPPNYMPKREDSIAAMAERQGRTAPEVAYDVLIEDGGRNFTRRWSTTSTSTCRRRKQCWPTGTLSWASVTAARMSALFWMPAIRPGC